MSDAWESFERAGLLIEDREEYAVLAWGWARYTHGDLSSHEEREAWHRFSAEMRGKEWFREAVDRLKARGAWDFADPDDDP